MTTRTELNARAAELLRLFNNEGTLVSYHCRVGDWVEADQALRDEEEKPAPVAEIRGEGRLCCVAGCPKSVRMSDVHSYCPDHQITHVPFPVAEAPERVTDEADGDGVSHEDARRHALGYEQLTTPRLLAYIDAQEQSEREAAQLRAENEELKAKLGNEETRAFHAETTLRVKLNDAEKSHAKKLGQLKSALTACTEKLADEPLRHSLNEYTVCVRCKQFDPPAPCPGKPVSRPSAPDKPLTRAELVKALRVAADGSDAGLSNFAYQLRLALREGGERE